MRVILTCVGVQRKYMEFLTVVESGTHDPTLYVKRAMIVHLYDLLVAKPGTPLATHTLTHYHPHTHETAGDSQHIQNDD
jgi:hypothetical protein